MCVKTTNKSDKETFIEITFEKKLATVKHPI